MFNAAVPIIQAPMLGASGPDMAREACLAGAIGSLAAAGLSPAALLTECANLRQAVGSRPFAVNLFILEPAKPDPAVVAAAIARLAPYREALGLPPQTRPAQWAEDFHAQFEALVEAAPPLASFTFGILSAEQVMRLHAVGTRIIGTATTLAEARAWAEVGADAICAQGMEAGGHRGTFLKPVEESLIGLVPLVSAICAAVSLPVIAAGGIMDGRGIAAMLRLGADAVQIGTAFLLSDESRISPPWRAALERADADSTQLTRAFSGRTARGIENRFMRDMADEDIPSYPIQNALTQEMRAAAAKAGNADLLSLWAGQGVGAIRTGKTRDLIARFWHEAQDIMA